MPQYLERRSPRLALRVPIRVFGIDFKGTDFVEDSTTVVVNLHGAKIRLFRQVIPEQEIRILSRQTGREAIFRVVGKLQDSENRCTYWGVECIDQDNNIWGVNFPPLGRGDQSSVRVFLRCPDCHAQELLYLDEPLVQAIEEVGGLVRGCVKCGTTSLWKHVPYFDS